MCSATSALFVKYKALLYCLVQKIELESRDAFLLKKMFYDVILPINSNHFYYGEFYEIAKKKQLLL